jgi:membrane protease YdiL (CAAX protease family)
MRVITAWLIYLAVVVGGGALLAPVLYRSVQQTAVRVPALRPLAEQPFHRYVNRSLLGLALLGLWPLLRRRDFMTWRELGWTGEPRPGRRAGLGVLLGIGGLGLAGGVVLAVGARVWRPELSGAELARIATLAAGSALAVAMIEETLFRGLLQGSLRRVWPPAAALVFSSTVYAALHFLNRVRWNAPVDWTSGFAVLGLMVAGFGAWEQVVPGFLNLCLAGLLLGWAFERGGSLYFPAGLHAGWVFALKLYQALTLPAAAGGGAGGLWGSHKLTDGWVVLPALAVTALVVPRALSRPEATSGRP